MTVYSCAVYEVVSVRRMIFADEAKASSFAHRLQPEPGVLLMKTKIHFNSTHLSFLPLTSASTRGLTTLRLGSRFVISRHVTLDAFAHV